jgi:hypothetical protein
MEGTYLKASLMQVIRSLMILELDVVSLSDLLPCSYMNWDKGAMSMEENSSTYAATLWFDVSLLQSNTLI